MIISSSQRSNWMWRFGRRSVFDFWSSGLICCGEIEKLTKGSLDSGSKSERRFDACQQEMNIKFRGADRVLLKNKRNLLG
jgi:hypothetical protein